MLIGEAEVAFSVAPWVFGWSAGVSLMDKCNARENVFLKDLLQEEMKNAENSRKLINF